MAAMRGAGDVLKVALAHLRSAEVSRWGLHLGSCRLYGIAELYSIPVLQGCRQIHLLLREWFVPSALIRPQRSGQSPLLSLTITYLWSE